VEQEEYHEKELGWSWARNKMGNIDYEAQVFD
jgi:hypothetical protein